MKHSATDGTARTGTKSTITAVAALLLGAGLIPAVNAATSDNVPSVVVKYDAESAATESGARELYRRLVSAARQVCPDHSSLGLIYGARDRQCREEAVARAVNQIHQPRLVEIAASRGKSI